MSVLMTLLFVLGAVVLYTLVFMYKHRTKPFVRTALRKEALWDRYNETLHIIDKEVQK